MQGPARSSGLRAILGHCLQVMAVLLVVGVPGGALAHKASDAYIDIRVRDTGVDPTLVVRWDIGVRDLDPLIDLDTDNDGLVRWGDILARRTELAALALGAISFDRQGEPCPATSPELSTAQRSDGSYVVLRFSIDCPVTRPAIEQIGIRYRLLADVDPTHRVIVSVNGEGLQTLQATNERRGFDLGDRSTIPGAQVTSFIGAGLSHILYGPDHLAFLLALLIAALAVPASHGAGRILFGLLTTVSVFTVAHSITLVLSAVSWLALPSRWVESAIAFSVVLAGLQAFAAATVGHRSRWAVVPLWLIFCFGLVHGIGFGSSLAESGFGGRSIVSALLGFNLGVEIGQLIALAAVLPLAWILVSSRPIRRLGLPAAALAISAFGMQWFAQRIVS